MKQIKELPLNDLKQYLKYDPITGTFTHTQGRNKNKRADYVSHKAGYCSVSVKSKRYFAHRVAYALYNNKSYVGIIDHINGDKKNNEITNLQELSNSVNIFKAKGRKNNVSGRRGVHYNKKTKFWEAYITKDGKRIYLGIRKEKEQAIALRANAESIYYRSSLSFMSSKSHSSTSSSGSILL